VLSFFTVDGDDAAIELCRKLLDYHGAGHTSNIRCAGVATALPPALTVGCGTFGGNSTTDNVTYRNLLNIKRVAHARA
jgi:hypothetical protein